MALIFALEVLVAVFKLLYNSIKVTIERFSYRAVLEPSQEYLRNSLLKIGISREILYLGLLV